MSQTIATAGPMPGSAPADKGPAFYERPAVTLTARVLSACGNAVFALGLVAVAVSLLN